MEGGQEPTALHLDGIRRWFGSVTALAGVDLTVDRGQFLTLLGPSGCGKTTLLRVIAGFERPNEGRVRIKGHDVGMLPPERRPVNLVFQRFALFPHLDVWGNVAFGLQVAGRGRREVVSEVGNALELVRLAGYERRRIDQLSGGEQQRVALARAVVNRPEILLLDEPLGALDLQLRKQMQLELRALHRALRTTFIYVTHDQEEALVMSDRIAVMRAGAIEQDGAPAEVYLRPVSRFVATFIGETNILEGRLRGDTVELPEIGITVPASRSGVPPGQVALSIRPEHIQLGARGEIACRGVIEDAIFIGPTIHYTVRIRQDLTMKVQTSPHHHDPRRPGEVVDISWKASDAVVLGT